MMSKIPFVIVLLAISLTILTMEQSPAQADEYGLVYLPLVTTGGAPSGTAIVDVSDNRADFPGSQVQKFEKFEITFQVINSPARN